jgi:hypothetical protein
MEANSLSLNQISAFEKEAELEIAKALVHPSPDFTVRVFVSLPLCLKDSPINRLADDAVDVPSALFPIPISNEFEIEIVVFMFCFTRNET